MSEKKIDAIIQARLASTRLPNKILMKILDKTLLEHVIDRVGHATYINNIYVATTINASDDKLCDFLDKLKIKYYRGSENDVLGRFYNTATHFACENIARITPDDPFKDPIIIDKVIELFFDSKLDFAYNNQPPSFPEGIDTEIFSFDALKQANEISVDSFEREHVTQYFYRHPELFKQTNYKNTVDLSFLRWTIDTIEDFNMSVSVYEKLYPNKPIFLMDDILELLDKYPYISKINNNVKRSYMYSKK